MRETPETGIVAFDMRRRGEEAIDRWLEIYTSGRFRELERWDDTWTFQVAVIDSDLNTRDATPDSLDQRVVETGPLRPFFRHFKGKHKEKGLL